MPFILEIIALTAFSAVLTGYHIGRRAKQKGIINDEIIKYGLLIMRSEVACPNFGNVNMLYKNADKAIIRD